MRQSPLICHQKHSNSRKTDESEQLLPAPRKSIELIQPWTRGARIAKPHQQQHISTYSAFRFICTSVFVMCVLSWREKSSRQLAARRHRAGLTSVYYWCREARAQVRRTKIDWFLDVDMLIRFRSLRIRRGRRRSSFIAENYVLELCFIFKNSFYRHFVGYFARWAWDRPGCFIPRYSVHMDWWKYFGKTLGLFSKCQLES